jgi:hypothetical protein
MAALDCREPGALPLSELFRHPHHATRVSMIPFAIGVLTAFALIFVGIATAAVIEQRRDRAEKRRRKEERWALREQERREREMQRLIEANTRTEFGSSGSCHQCGGSAVCERIEDVVKDCRNHVYERGGETWTLEGQRCDGSGWNGQPGRSRRQRAAGTSVRTAFPVECRLGACG